MITEDYVSFETAKLLKEKGMDAPFFAFYRTDEKGKFYHHPSCRPLCYDEKYIDDEVVAAFTLQMAMKWLREVHSLSVEVQFFLNEENDISSWNYDIIDIITYCNKARYAMCVNFETYEQAVEAAVKYVLENLI